MERLIVLGTGNAQAIHCYNTCYAMQKGEEYFLHLLHIYIFHSFLQTDTRNMY
ncbi:hypothetical protein ACXWPT_09705 [Streptococcus pyogenes]